MKVYSYIIQTVDGNKQSIETTTPLEKTIDRSYKRIATDYLSGVSIIIDKIVSFTNLGMREEQHDN